jgi:hypothetical protein
MPAPLHIGTIHDYAINKRTPALLTTSQPGSAGDRQHRHHSPVTAALSTRVLLCCETTARLYQKKNAFFRATVSADSQPASRYATRSARCTTRCSAGQKERSIALYRATVSADLLRIVRDCRGKYQHPT